MKILEPELKIHLGQKSGIFFRQNKAIRMTAA